MENILYIEDEIIMQNVVNKVLTKEGYHVDIAKDGREGLQKLEENNYNYHMVITDIMMPFFNGFEVIAKIRNFNPTLPIIIISSIGNEEAVLEGFNIGANDYIKKPVIAWELILRVKKLLTL